MRTQPLGRGVFTLADLDDWPESTNVELHQGSIVVNPPPTGHHAIAVNRTVDWLARAGIDRNLVFQGIGIGFEHEPGDGFTPDVVVMKPGWNPARVWQPPSAVRIVVEVVSSSTASRDRGHKRGVYLAAGLTVVIVDPMELTIDVAGPDAWLAGRPF